MKPTILQGHTRPIKSINLSPSGSILFSASIDRTIIAWDLTKNEKAKAFMHAAAINCFVISPCGTYMISGDNTATIYIWDIEKSVVLTSIEGNPSEVIKSVAMNSTGTLILVSYAGRAKTAVSKLKTFIFKELLPLEISSSELKEEKPGDIPFVDNLENKLNKNENSFGPVASTNGVLYDLNSDKEKGGKKDRIETFDKNDGLKSEEYSNKSIYNVCNNSSMKKAYVNYNNFSNNTNDTNLNNFGNNNNNSNKSKIKKTTEPQFQTRKLKAEDVKPLSVVSCSESKYVKALYTHSDKYILTAKEDGSLELLDNLQEFKITNSDSYNLLPTTNDNLKPKPNTTISSSDNTHKIHLAKKVHSEAILDIDYTDFGILTASSDGYCCFLDFDLEPKFKFQPLPVRNINSCKLMLIDNPFLVPKSLNVDDLFANNIDEKLLLEDSFLHLRKQEKLPLAVFSGGQDSKLVTTTHKNEGGFELVVHELVSGKELLFFQSHFGPVNAVGCIWDKPTLATGSEDSTVRVFNLNECIKSLDK